MATPPRITATERDAAIARIDRRHARIDDPRRSELGTDPRAVVSWVLERGPVGVPRWIAAADHHDALILATWCWWQERHRERRLLRQGLHLGLSAAELATPLGMQTRQGLRDRLDRLDALVAHDCPDEQLARESRRARRERGAGQRWIDTHRPQIRSVLAALHAQARRLLDDAAASSGGAGRGDDDRTDFADPGTAGHPDHDPEVEADVRDWLDELERDLVEDAITPATLAVTGMLSGGLRSHPRVTALDRRHRLVGALAAADRVRSRFAGAHLT